MHHQLIIVIEQIVLIELRLYLEEIIILERLRVYVHQLFILGKFLG